MNDKKKVRGYQLSLQGQNLAKKSRELRGWPVDDFRWLLEASKLLQPNDDWSQYKGYYAYNISEGSWRRFLYGGAVNDIAFQTYCELLNIESDDVLERNKFNWFEDLSLPEKKISKELSINMMILTNVI